MLWVKALHIIFVICWFAGIFYLPRLFVYHAMAEDQSTRDHLKIMERKLYLFMSQFAVFSVAFGIWLALDNWAGYQHAAWFYAKLALVGLIIVYHLICGRYVKQLANDRMRSHVFYRWFNEVPVLALFPIVILVVVKPF
jgi:putative membrane protein